MCSNTCVFLVVLGLKVGSTDVFKATLEVCEPWSGIKRYGDSDSLAHPVQKSVRKLMRNKTWGKADNDSGGLWHQILPHSSGCYCQPHFPDDKTESSRSQVTGQTPLSSQGAGSSVLAPDSSPPPHCPQSCWGSLGTASSQAAYWVTMGRARPHLDESPDGISEHPLGDQGLRESRGSCPCQVHLLRLTSSHVPCRGRCTLFNPDQETK